MAAHNTAVNNNSMLRFERIEKHFGETRVLNHINLDIPRGQFCVILGPSGAGKSTLLRLVNGLVAPSTGAVYVDGRRVQVSSLKRIRPGIGMIHQHFNLVQRATVATNVLSGALPSIPLWRALLMWFPAVYRRKACLLAEAVGLDAAQLTRRVGALSGGQQQRVGIARAFMLDPSVILADEPVASLDPKISRDILSLLRDESRRRGATVLCTLHQIDLAREFADRIVAVRGGEMVFDGEPAAFDETSLKAIYGESGTSSDPSREVNEPEPLRGMVAEALA